MSLKIRLAVVMFLCFFVLGSWVVTLGLVMTKHGMGSEIGNAFSSIPIASLCTPFLMGYFVDRYFSAERVMTVLHLSGSVLLACMPHFIETGNVAGFLITLYVYNLLFMPTFSLMNNIAFGHVENAEKMPYVRLFANVGWIVPGFALGAAGLSDSPSIFYLAAIASLCLGLASLTLPARPPAKSAQAESKLGTLEHLMSVLRSRDFMALLIGMIVISVPMAFYYAYTSTFADAVGFKNVGATLSAGQMSELVAIALIPVLIKHIGYKWMLLIGMAGWVARYVLFSIGAIPASQPLVFIGIVVHGICYDFLFVTAVIFTETLADARSKAQAQGVVVFCTYGLGQLIGSQVSQFIYNRFLPPHAAGLTLALWKQFWLYPAGAAVVGFLVILVGFRGEKARQADRRAHGDNVQVKTAM